MSIKIVAFLGAGFSAPFGLPVMSKFLEVASRSGRLTDAQKLELLSYVLEARQTNAFLESSPTNLEDILTFAVMANRLDPTPENNARAESLRKTLATVYTDGADCDNYWEQFAPHSEAFSLKPARESDRVELSIVTTNYDLVVESILWRHTRARLNFQWNPRNDSNNGSHGSLYSQNGIPLFKLHGSVNWYSSGQAVNVEDQVVGVRGRVTHSGSLPRACTANYKFEAAPLLVAPTFLKPQLSEALGLAWQGAYKAIKDAERLIFIGYSFPLSDNEMKYFLAAALRENTKIRRILVVDPDADKIVERLKSPNSRFGTHFRELLYGCNGGWTDSEPTARLRRELSGV